VADLLADHTREAVDTLTGPTVATLTGIWQQITQAEQALLDGWPGWRRPRRTAELRELRALIATLTGRAQAAAREFAGVTLPQAFTVGDTAVALTLAGSATLSVDRTVLAAAQAESLDALLDAALGVRRSTALLIEQLAAAHLDDLVLAGQHAIATGRTLAERLAEHRIVAVTYRNGARHGLDSYAEMLVRTKTAETYQAGGFARMAAAGVRYVELVDGFGCGLTSHEDPAKANGLILPLADARNYPTSHPNCVRSSLARPDLATAAEAARATPSTTAAQDADQALVAALRAETVARRSKAAQRFARTRSGLLSDGPFRAGSVAAMRHARRVARRVG